MHILKTFMLNVNLDFAFLVKFYRTSDDTNFYATYRVVQLALHSIGRPSRKLIKTWNIYRNIIIVLITEFLKQSPLIHFYFQRVYN